MKAIILASLLVVFLSLSSVFAQGQGRKVLANIETTKSGTVKEYVEVESETLKPLMKTVYQYGTNNNIRTKVCYNWDEASGWVNEKKYEYEYNRAGKVKNLVYTKWDENQQAWSSESERFFHVYDSNGKLLAVKQIRVNRAQGVFIAVM